MEAEAPLTLSELTTGIVASYVGKNHVAQSDLPELISTVWGSLAKLGSTAPEVVDTSELQTKAQIRRSIRADGLVSFIDGKTYKTLKRHLTAKGVTPAEYRDQYGLGADYPMICADYAAFRSAYAKSAGLGLKREPAAKPKAKAEPAAPVGAKASAKPKAPAKATAKAAPKKAAIKA
jgi:predicted transcriptional regulator